MDDPTTDTDRMTCRYCGGELRRLGPDDLDGVGPDADGREPQPGDWAEPATGIDCPGNDDRVHMPAVADRDTAAGRAALAAVVAEHYHGDWDAAITDLGEQGQVAVTTLTREDFRRWALDEFDAVMTHEQWEIIAGLLDQFDDYVIAAAAGPGSFLNRALLRAGTLSEDDLIGEYGVAPDDGWRWMGPPPSQQIRLPPAGHDAPAAAVRPAVAEWPANTATPPAGWEILTDPDGTRPMGWFTVASGGMRAVVRGYPTWEDAPFAIPAESRVRTPDPDDPDDFLHDTFDIAYRGYAFPDVDPASGLPTHGFTNLDVVGGWTAAVGHWEANAAAFARVLAGAKPAAEVTVRVETDVYFREVDAEQWASQAQSLGLGTICFDHKPWTTMWVAPPRLADRVDPDDLASAWHALADADPVPTRAGWVRRTVEEGLRDAFSIDLLEPLTRRERRLTQPWWDESTYEGLVTLGAVLGYPPASTYALMIDTVGHVLRSVVPPSARTLPTRKPRRPGRGTRKRG